MAVAHYWPVAYSQLGHVSDWLVQTRVHSPTHARVMGTQGLTQVSQVLEVPLMQVSQALVASLA